MLFNPGDTGLAPEGSALSRSFAGAACCLAVCMALGFAGAEHRDVSWCLEVVSFRGFVGQRVA